MAHLAKASTSSLISPVRTVSRAASFLFVSAARRSSSCGIVLGNGRERSQALVTKPDRKEPNILDGARGVDPDDSV